MTQDEFSLLFHRAQVNLVAFKMLYEPEAFEAMRRMVEMAISEEREAMLDFIGEFMGTEGSRNAMFSDGYDYALGQMKELLEGRMKR